ncbi:hypothetical protein [Niallia sp. 03133]|uniref:hypothetical protein n=1 Tax=Niallia sp. 03133 TaxID=3458060 RepID=UPI0040447979
MKNYSYCLCGSGKPQEICCENTSQTKVILHPIENPLDRKKFLKKIEISSHFNMRFRALFEFYGDDLIDYKREYLSDPDCNEFLRIFSKYMTDYLEDKVPSSWETCKSPFWEKLIYLYFPLSIKLSPEKKETEKFLMELKKFCFWLDFRANTSFFKTISNYKDALNDLIGCEQLLNALFQINFPKIHQEGWDINKDLDKMEEEFCEFANTEESLFEITSIIGDTVVLTDLGSNRMYNTKGLPLHVTAPGLILHGTIGRKPDDLFWSLHEADGVYPHKAKRYFLFE